MRPKLRIDLEAAPGLAVGAGPAKHDARVHRESPTQRIEAGIPGRRVDRTGDSVGSEERRRTPATNIDRLDAPRIDGEKILVGTLAKDRVVQTNTVKEKEGLLPRATTDIGRSLAMGRLLNINARLKTEGIGRRPRQALLEIAPGDAR